MKLRNKKTGEAVYVDFQIPLVNGRETLGAYSVTSLKELNESWEDYRPDEPLIKDEKIRKEVRVWAEVNGINTTKIRVSKGFIFTSIIGLKDRTFCRAVTMDFETSLLRELGDCREYTLEELCGEEE